MANISDMDKLGMAALIASTEGGQTPNRAKKSDRSPPIPRPRPTKPRKITKDDIKSGRVSIGDANDSIMTRGFKHGGKIDGAAMKGRTRGKMC